MREIIRKLRRKPWRETCRAIWGRVRLLLGLAAPMRTPDRAVLESIIIPFYVARGVGRVLFVGTDWFTKHYERFFAGCEYWTIEVEARRRGFGAKLHVVDSLENLDRHFPASHFDLILCNGVFGWGLDEPESCERAFQQCYDCLREQGVLVVGWNEAPEHNPVPLESLHSLAQFARLEDSPLGTWRYAVPASARHIYDFYTKNSAERPAAVS